MQTEVNQQTQKARDIVFRMLKIRFRSEKEVRDRLKRKGIPEDTVEKTIQYFKNLEFLDDQQFARKWIEARLNKPLGTNRIQFELKTKGVAPEIVNEEIKRATSEYPEEEIVAQLARKRASLYYGIDKDKMKQRVYGYLVRRGFNTEVVGRVIRKIEAK